MKKQTYFEFLKKFYGERIDIMGIEIIPTFISDEFKVISKIENPKDLSYSRMCLTEHLIEKLEMFNKIIGFPTIRPQINCENIYVNEELLNRTKEILSNKKEVLLERRWSSSNLDNTEPEITIIVEHVKSDYSVVKSNYGLDDLYICNHVKPIKSFYTKTGDECHLDNSIKEYDTFFKENRIHDSDNYPELDDLLNDYPTLINIDWFCSFYNTIFI